MNSPPTVIVFARAPQLGAVKTRLAADIGRVAAWRFHRNQVAHLLRRLISSRRWKVVLAITPDSLSGGMRLSAPPTIRMAQGDGDLGIRMTRALNQFLPGRAIIIGSDIPAITNGRIGQAFAALAKNELVFGPATDGGYWLVGVRGRNVPPRLFRNVRWSAPTALEDTLRNLEAPRSAAMIDTLSDVDTGADYRLIGNRD